MTDSRRERALTAARIRLRSPVPRPLLDETRIDEVCAELLAYEEREKAQAEYSEAYLDWLERGGKQPTEGTQQPRHATIDTEGGSGHG